MPANRSRFRQEAFRSNVLSTADLSRRVFGLTATCAAVSLLTHGAHAQSTEDSPRIWGNAAQCLETMIRIMGRTDAGIAIRWTHGVLSGIVDQETTQLLRVSQQIFSRHRRRNDGSFDAVYLEFVYFTDPDTDKVPEEWTNPYTGRTIPIPTQILGPTRFHIPLSLTIVNEPYAMEGIVNTHWLEPLPSAGGDVLFNERIDSYVPAMTDDGKPIKFHEVFAFRAPLDELTETSSPHVPATVDKVNIISWRPWMDMDEIDGVSMSRGGGRVITDYDDLPADLAQKNEIFFPDVVDEMEDYLSL